MDEKGFKKLLIDLEFTRGSLGEEVGISAWAVTLYFRGELRSTTTRARLKRVLSGRAGKLGIQLPRFWEDAAA